METAMSKCMKESEDKQNTKKIKIKIKINRIFFLPDDILLDILERVPEAFLRYKVKYVCRQWFNLITNKILLDHASFILQNCQKHEVRLVDIREEQQAGLQVKQQYLDIPLKGKIEFWCNELLLISRPKSLHVLNLITMEVSSLPECSACCGCHWLAKCSLALSFDRKTGIYKVVHVIMGPPYECEFLIYGDSSTWKKIQFWPNVNIQVGFWSIPVLVQGRYLHWRIIQSNDLLSVDTVTEKIRRIRLPGSRDRGRKVRSCFEMGGLLAFFDGTTNLENAEIWVLKDFDRITWEKMRSITVNYNYFQKYPHTIGRYYFCGMTSKRYMILESRAPSGMYSYDLKCGVVKKLDIHMADFEMMGRVGHSLPRFL